MSTPSQIVPLINPVKAPTVPAVVVSTSRPKTSLFQAHMDLGKVRLNALVVFTTALGYVVGSASLEPAPFDWPRLFFTCVGTFLAAVGASAFNQAIEAHRDARMNRTKNRPLPARRLSRTYAATFGLIVSICGVAILCPTSDGTAAILASVNILIYALLYTPLKPISTLNTLVGAVVGAIPPVLGWAAATNTIPPGALILGAILFVWQIPHFLALCWIYREDYARGGFKMLPILDKTGRLTAKLALIYSILLMPLCLLVALLGHAGLPFVIVSGVLTLALIAAAYRFNLTRANKDARRLFLASIIYLPLLAITLMIDARGPFDGLRSETGGYVHPSDQDNHFIDPDSLPRLDPPLGPPAPADLSPPSNQ